jgi:hypothetical protein
MNETLEERLKEAMERRAADLPVPMAAPARVVRRTRRRQAVVGTLAAVAAVALLLGSFVGVRELWTGAQKAGGSQQQTTTVNGVTVSYPAGWHFENAIAATRGSGLFIVANYTPPVPFVDLEDRDVCTPTAAVMAVQDHSAIGTDGDHPGWPVTLRPGPVQVPGCAESLVATWSAGGRSFGAAVLFGNDVSASDRATMEGVFRSLRFGPGQRSSGTGKQSGPISSFTGRVIARGTTAGKAWTVSVQGKAGNLTVSAETEGQGVGIGMATSQSGDVATLSVAALRLGTEPDHPRVVFGLASAKVSSVHVEPTHEFATLYPISGNTQVQVFVVEVPSVGPKAIVVAEDEGGLILEEQRFGSGLAAPEPIESPPSPTPAPPS